MGKKIFTILVAMILCVSLAACGHDNTPAPKDDDNATAAETADPADVAGESGEADTATDEGLADGTYEHRIGDCVFYTENDLDQWINDGVFDFYGMMDYFGWTEREFPNNENTYSAFDGEYGIVMRLWDDGDSTYYPHLGSTGINGHIFDIVVDSGQGEILHMPSGMKISRYLCELILYTMESEARDPEMTTDDLSVLVNALPAGVRITWK